MNTSYMVTHCHGIKDGKIPNWKSWDLHAYWKDSWILFRFYPCSSSCPWVPLTLPSSACAADWHTQRFTCTLIFPRLQTHKHTYTETHTHTHCMRMCLQSGGRRGNGLGVMRPGFLFSSSLCELGAATTLLWVSVFFTRKMWPCTKWFQTPFPAPTLFLVPSSPPNFLP